MLYVFYMNFFVKDKKEPVQGSFSLKKVLMSFSLRRKTSLY